MFHVIILIALAGAVGVARFDPSQMVEPDSGSYIHFAGIRGLGYPFFLFLLRSLGIPLLDVFWVQLALHLATIPVLFGVLRRCTGNVWLPSLIVLVTYTNPEVADYYGKILTESLFLTVLVLFISFFLLFLRDRLQRDLLLASLFLAIDVTIKPAAWAFVVLLSLVVLASVLQGRQRLRLIAVLLVPVIGFVVADQIAWRIIQGPVRASLAPLHLFAKAGMIDAAVPKSLLTEGPNAPLQRALEQDAAPIRRLIERVPSATIARYLTANYEVFVQYRFAMAERRAIAEKRNLDKALFDAGLERLRYGWPNYLRLTAHHYMTLWLIYNASHPAFYRAVNAFIAANRPLPYEKSVPLLTKTVKSAGLKAVVARFVIAAAGVATFLLAGLGLFSLFRPDATPILWRQAGLLALGLHGYSL